jgi:hypothetical protein
MTSHKMYSIDNILYLNTYFKFLSEPMLILIIVFITYQKFV